MARTYIDRRGGHTNSFLDTGDGLMVTSASGRRFFKRRCVHQMRRESRLVTAAALHEYWDDLQERRTLDRELYESEEYSPYYCEPFEFLDKYGVDREEELRSFYSLEHEDDMWDEEDFTIHMPDYYDRYH